MKFTSLILIGVCQATTLLTACGPQSNPLSSQDPQVNLIGRSQDKELLKDVEQFAGGGNESASAWQNLMHRDKQKLIDDLSRISNALPTDDRDRVLIAFTFCKMRHEYAANRQVVVSALSKTSPYKDLYGDWVVTMLSTLVSEGDKDLLDPLFKASEWSDGAMTTDLASAYSDALLIDPNTFLRLLSMQSQHTRDSVIYLLRDNSLTPEQTREVKIHLKAVVPPSKLAPVATQTLRALSKRNN